ncbi:MAG: signal transducing kinase of the PAK, partial [Marteilia pararefringens]
SEEECYIYAKKYLGQVITNGNFSDKYTMGHKVGKGATSIVNTCFLKENTSHNKLQEIQDGALEPVTSISRNLSSLKLSKADENDHMDTKFVAKIVKIGSNQTLCEVLCFETEIMYALDSWNIVKFYDCFLSNDPGDSVFSMYLVMEYLNGVNISELSNNVVLPDNFIKPIGYEIIKGIEYLHSVQIIHRDIKGGNIIVDFNKKRIVLIDFGFAADLKRNSQHKTLVGTYHWIAPEVINRIFYSYPIDIWSSGIVLIELFQGHPPFVEYKNCRDILNAILSLDVVSTIEDSSDASESYLKIVSSMLIKEPAKRATIGRLKKHEFFEDKMAISDCLTQIHELISDD